jgi:DNA-binding CsgD family transcriptional regulator
LNINIPSQQFINQIPGIFYAVDMQGKFIYANDTTAKCSGYDNHENFIGLTYEDMKCPAVELHESYSEQDTLSTESSAPIKIIAYLTYAGDETNLLLGTKSQLLDNSGNVCGVLTHAVDYKNNHLINLSHLYTNNRKDITQGQLCFIVRDCLPCFNLSKKQAECLYFYIRGMTAKEIAEKLYVSRRTVEQHLIAIKRNLRCSTRSQIVEKCHENNFFNTIPETLLSKLYCSA